MPISVSHLPELQCVYLGKAPNRPANGLENTSIIHCLHLITATKCVQIDMLLMLQHAAFSGMAFEENVAEV